MLRKVHRFYFLLIMMFCSGCSLLPVFMGRNTLADNIAYQAGFTKEYIKADKFDLLTYQKGQNFSRTMRVYIEGDGQAWKTKHYLSNDPTPKNPLGLRLAVLDPADNVVYIARPGQFRAIGNLSVDSLYWSERRFAPEVVQAFNAAIDQLKENFGVKNVELIGYSGGGALAVLIAAERNDVASLRTVAGNLDIKAWCDYHQVSQLNGSLNPLDVANKVAYIPQRHFVGVNDRVMPLFIAQNFIKALGDKNEKRLTVVVKVTHNLGWLERWRALLKESLL